VFAVILSSLTRRSTAFSVRPARRAVTSSIVLRMSTSSGAMSPDDFIQMQKETSNATMRSENSQQAYLQHQQQVFDEMSDFFASDDATPPEVVPVMQHLAHCILKRFQDQPARLMDVGCGTGALFPFYLEAAKDLNITLDITGVDLSPKMASLARHRADNLVSDDNERSITVVDGDFVELMQGDENEYRDSYDAVVANACFANFFDTGMCQGW